MGSTIIRKLPQTVHETRTCQRCGHMFTCAEESRALNCPACIQIELERLMETEKKTEPPCLSLAAPSPIGSDSISHELIGCQPDNKPGTENGEPALAGPPRLPSGPLDFLEHPRRKTPENAGLGSTATYPTPPAAKLTGSDLILGAFRLLEPMHRLYVRDFESESPKLNHGKTGWPHRCAFCHHASVPGLVGAELRRKDDGEHVRVGIGGVVHCGNIWLCPVCGLYSALKWQQDVIASERALRSDGYRLLLCVLTISHHTDTSLEDEIRILRAAYTELFQQRKKSQKKRAKKWGIVGRLRAWDVLYGVNGWHAHMNVTIVLEPGSKVNIEQIHKALDCAYRQAIKEAGGFASAEHGLKITEYVNGKAYTIRTGMEGLESRSVGDKFALGYEMISTGQKSQHGLSIGALRLATTDGFSRDDWVITPAQAGALCLEYGATMSGERSTISAGVFRDKLHEVGTAEKSSDEENSAAPIGDYAIMGIIKSADYHREIVGKNRFVPLLQAMKAGLPDLKTYLAGIGIDLGELPQRRVSLQFAASAAHKEVDIRDKETGLERVERAALIWKGGAGGEADSNDLDDFL